MKLRSNALSLTAPLFINVLEELLLFAQQRLESSASHLLRQKRNLVCLRSIISLHFVMRRLAGFIGAYLCRLLSLVHALFRASIFKKFFFDF